MAAAKHTNDAKPARRRVPQLTLAQLKASMAKTKPGFDAYEQARLTIKKGGLSKKAEAALRATMEQHRPAFTEYWRGFNDPRMRAQREKARAAKAAAARAKASRAA
jgi:hypothetical protein